MSAQIRRLREGIEDEAPLHYEGMPLRRRIGVAGRAVGGLAVLAGVAGMTRGSGTVLEPVGALAGAVGVVLLILSWRFGLFEIVVGDRWLIVRCGPVHHRFGRSDVLLGPAGPASSWRRLYAPYELAVRRLSAGRPVVIPVGDPGALRTAVEGVENGTN